MKNMLTFLTISATLCNLTLTPEAKGNTVILDPTPHVQGVVGLNGETFASGWVYSSSGGFSYSASFGSDGAFSIPVTAGAPFTLDIRMYQFQNTPGAQLRQFLSSQPAIASGETREIDLRRDSGRIDGSVLVTGGVLQSVALNASSIDGVNSSFYGSAGTSSPPHIVSMPMPVVSASTNVYGTATIRADKGCVISRSLQSRSISVQSGAETSVSWSVDVSNETCETGSLEGTLIIEGLSGQNSDAVESRRTVTVYGPSSHGLSLAPNQESYIVPSLKPGSYSQTYSLSFNAPYQSFSANGQGGIQVLAGETTQTSRTAALATIHGTLDLSGAWTLGDVNYAQIRGYGGGTNGGYSYDVLDLATGNFDLVVGAGTSDISYFYFNDSNYDSISGDQVFWNTYEFLYGSNRPMVTLAVGERQDLGRIVIETSSIDQPFQVAQVDGQPLAEINRLDIAGSGYVRDPVTNATLAYRYINQSDRRSPSQVFNVSLRGLPGTYQMQARGFGTDGRQYAAPFEITLGRPDGTPAGQDVQNEFKDENGKTLGTVTFANVLEGGETTVSQTTLGPNAPRNFKIYKVGGQPQYFDISTTAVFNGLVEVCLHYDDSSLADSAKEADMELAHFDDTTQNWELITSPDSPDTVNNIICGFTDSFSIFAILEVDVVDADLDGVPDDIDNCPVTANEYQQDFDADGIGDACDSDSDGDGIPDATDLCPGFYSVNNSDLDGDAIGDSCDDDMDGDGVVNAVDNCPVVANGDQSDFDRDGSGDQCDIDDDGDNVDDVADSCPGTAAGAIIDLDGCSSPQRFESACPSGGAYRNHGQYVSCIAREAIAQVNEGLISEDEKGVIVSSAAESDIGKNIK